VRTVLEMPSRRVDPIRDREVETAGAMSMAVSTVKSALAMETATAVAKAAVAKDLQQQMPQSSSREASDPASRTKAAVVTSRLASASAVPHMQEVSTPVITALGATAETQQMGIAESPTESAAEVEAEAGSAGTRVTTGGLIIGQGSLGRSGIRPARAPGTGRLAVAHGVTGRVVSLGGKIGPGTIAAAIAGSLSHGDIMAVE